METTQGARSTEDWGIKTFLLVLVFISGAMIFGLTFAGLLRFGSMLVAIALSCTTLLLDTATIFGYLKKNSTSEKVWLVTTTCRSVFAIEVLITSLFPNGIAIAQIPAILTTIGLAIAPYMLYLGDKLKNK